MIAKLINEIEHDYEQANITQAHKLCRISISDNSNLIIENASVAYILHGISLCHHMDQELSIELLPPYPPPPPPID